MPWKGRTPMDLRIEFMSRLHRGEKLTDLCVEYGISRKTGHKFKQRYEELGAAGLLDQSRAPKHIPHKTTPEVVALLVAERKQHPSWGPKKLKHVLEQRLGHSLPAASTINDILVRQGLVERRRTRPRHRPQPTQLRQSEAPNDVWCVDYKGHFRLGDQSYCYPLTVTDQFSRFILACEGMARIDEEQARESFALLFRQYGLPTVIRSDNGVPFASVGLLGLSKLSVLAAAGHRARAHPTCASAGKR